MQQLTFVDMGLVGTICRLNSIPCVRDLFISKADGYIYIYSTVVLVTHTLSLGKTLVFMYPITQAHVSLNDNALFGHTNHLGIW